MKKITFTKFSFAILVCLLALSACGPSPHDGAPQSEWYVSTQFYEGSTVDTAGGNQITASNNDNSIQIFFSAFPTNPNLDTVYYHVVSESKAANHTLASNECAVEMTVISGSNEHDYLSLSNNTDSIQVLRNLNGSYYFDIPRISFLHLLTPSSGIPVTVDSVFGGEGFIQQ